MLIKRRQPTERTAKLKESYERETLARWCRKSVSVSGYPTWITRLERLTLRSLGKIKLTIWLFVGTHLKTLFALAKITHKAVFTLWLFGSANVATK